MLIVDGIEYRPQKPKNEEELESFVVKYANRIFDEDTLYFPVKTKLTSLGGIGSIPDGYAVTLSEPHHWFIIEVELYSHKLFDHIISQTSRFVQGFKESGSRLEVAKALYKYVTSDPVAEASVRQKLNTGEIFRFFTETLEKPPILVVIIDEKTKDLQDAINDLRLDDKRVIEFTIFERTDAHIKNAVQFEPITEKPTLRPTPRTGQVTPQSEYALPILESLTEFGGANTVRKVLELVRIKMEDKLTPADLEQLPSRKETRWINHARWESFHLKQEDYLRKGSNGTWEITPKGRDYYKTNTSKTYQDQSLL